MSALNPIPNPITFTAVLTFLLGWFMTTLLKTGCIVSHSSSLVPFLMHYANPDSSRSPILLICFACSQDFLSNKTGPIGYNTNCSIKIRDSKNNSAILPFYDPSHLCIESNKNVSYLDAKNNLQRAKEQVEDILIEYIKGDNSKGRLFYDMAISCSFFHGQIDERRSTIHQRNPFASSDQRVWMNIIELPYCRDRDSNRKMYKSFFIVNKSIGLLGTVHGRTGCIVKICDDNLNVPVQYGEPYVLVTGSEPHLVDEAVQIITRAIKDYLKTNDDLRWREHSEQRQFSLSLQNKRH